MVSSKAGAVHFGAAVLYACVTIIAKGFPRSNGAQLTFVQCLCGVLVLAPWLPLQPQNLGAEQWGWLAMIGGVHTCAVYVLLYNALPNAPHHHGSRSTFPLPDQRYCY